MTQNPTDYLHKARVQYRAAHHLLTVTYPLIQDPKLLVGIITNIFESMDATANALLISERQSNKSFLDKLDVLTRILAPKHSIQQEHLELLHSLSKLTQLHKKSPMAFKRKDKFVICDTKFDMKFLSKKDIQEWIKYNKQFLEHVQGILNRKE